MKPATFLQFCLLTLATGCVGYQDYSCAGSAGDTPDATHTEGPDQNLGNNYVAEHPKYTIGCCAVITQWNVKAGKEGTIQLQIWRRLSNTNYQMIGENYCIITSTDIGNVKQCPIDVQDQMVVQKGDFMGWHSNGEELLMYKDAHYQDNTLSSMFRRMKPTSSSGTGDLHPGQLFNWQAANVYNDRDYAIEVIYVTSSPPVVTPILATVQIPDYNISSATITRITYSDPDVADNNTLSKFALQSAPFFSLDLNSGFVMGDSSYPFRARDSQIGLSVYDTCYNSASASVNFDVTSNEKKLTFESLPASFTLPKNGTSQSLIHRITWTDTANDPVYCRYIGTDPFLLQPLSTSEYGLYVSEYAFTDLAAPSTYTLSITCTETRVVTTTTEASVGTVTIYVTDNLAPSITNLDGSATVDAETAKAGDIVYTVSSSDPEGDVVSYSATCTPLADCPLEIRQTGEIQINRGLLFSQSHSYTLEITITDSYNNQDGPNFFLLTIQNINNDASFTNLPLSTTLEVMENTPVDTPLYTILYHDRDIADTKIMTVTYDDPRLSRLFNLDSSTGVLSTAFNEIDYEMFTHPTTYTLTVALGDTKSDITETINLKFVNQNEPPRFTKDYFDITVEEGDDGFSLTDGLMFTNNVYDEDTLEVLNMETHTYSLDCENGTQTHRFYLNPTTASLVFAGPFDLDTTGTPNEVSCDITVTDKYGLTATADIHIHVTNKNDFSPEFSKTSYTIYVQPDTLIGTSVLTVSADDLDADLDNDKEFYYTLNQSALGTEYFHVDQNGRVFLVASFSLGQSHNPFIVVVNNPSDPVKSGTATIQAVIPSSTTTAAGTTTDRNIGFYEDLYNTIWLLLVLGGIIIIVLTISLVMFQIMNLQIIPVWCRICCINCKQRCCKPKPDPERGFGDRGYDLTSFGHEHKYTDDDDIDGWIRRQGPKDTKQPQGGYHRFGVSQDNSKQVVRKDPIYEMFRVPTPTNQDRLDRTGPKITWKRGQRF